MTTRQDRASREHRADRLTPIRFGATPIKTTAEGFKWYEGTATIGDVILPYSEPHLHLEFRPAHEVASPEAVASMVGLPLTYEHPEDLLSPDTAKEHTEGAVVEAWREEGDHPKIRVRVVVFTRALQEAIEGGKVELSPGYSCDPDEAPGEFRGQNFHVVQRNVKYNHLAVVDRARTRTPTGEVARLDEDDNMQTEKPGEAQADANTNRTDAMEPMEFGFSEEGAALLVQLPEADRAILEKLMTCAKAEAAEEEAIAAGASAEEAEAVEEAAKGEEEMEDKMDMKSIMDRLAKMEAALNAKAAPAAPAPAAPVAKKDSDARLDAAAEAKIAGQVATQIRAEFRLANTVRRDSADIFGDDDSISNVHATMLGEVKRSTPGVEAAMKRALASGRMDDAMDLYRSAVEARRKARVDAMEDTLGGVVESMNAGINFSEIEALPG